MSALDTLNLRDNQLSGQIPAALANLSSLRVLYLHNNRLSGTLPAELGNLPALRVLQLNGNQLSGAIPENFRNLPVLQSLDIRWNALYTTDSDLRTFLNGVQSGGDWESTQTVVPSNITISGVTNNSVTLSWTPIAYTANTGGYEVYYSTQPIGPYTLFTTTANKAASSATVTGLNENTKYYFSLRTATNPHANNQNAVFSRYSNGGLHVMYAGMSGVHPLYTQSIMYMNNLSGSWSTPQTEAVSQVNNGVAVSSAVDQYGNWHAVYSEEILDPGTGYLTSRIKYASANTSPVILAVDGWGGAIAIDSNGKLHVMYSVFTSPTYPSSASIMYINNVAGFWSSPVAAVVSPNAIGDLSIAVDLIGNWHVVYDDKDEINGYSIKYASSTTSPVILSSLSDTWSPSIAVDSNGKLHVMFAKGSPGPPYTRSIMYMSNITGSWSTPQAIIVSAQDINPFTVDLYTGDLNVALAIDQNGNWHAVYGEDAFNSNVGHVTRLYKICQRLDFSGYTYRRRVLGIDRFKCKSHFGHHHQRGGRLRRGRAAGQC